MPKYPIALLISLLFSAEAGLAQSQEPVRFLGAFDTIGTDVSVSPISDTQLEYCWSSTSGQSRCTTQDYSVGDAVANFAVDDIQFAFDFVTNVLTRKGPDGSILAADMTPVARGP